MAERNDGRNERGHFVKGHPNTSGGGRKSARFEEGRLAVLEHETTDDKWRAICAKAIDDAINGDGRTRERGRRFVADYLIGRPRQTITLETRPPDPFAEYDGYSDEQLRAIADGGGGALSAGGTGSAGTDGGAATTGTPSPD